MKPALHLPQAREGAQAAAILRHLLAEHRIKVLNVAGPRGSNEPEVSAYVHRRGLHELIIPPAWSPIQTLTLTNGSAFFTDPYYANYPSRFYRLRWP